MTVKMTPRHATVAIGMILLGLIGGLGGGWLTTYTRAEEVTAERDQAVAEAEANCAQVEALGWACVEDPEDLRGESGAEGPPGPSGPPGPPGAGMTGPQIEAAFAAYFAEHPYEFEPSAAELTAAFAAVLSDNPDLLHDQLYAAMAAYLAANPPPPGPAGTDGKDGADGQDGTQGDPGRPPTEEEIRAQIEAYVAEHGLPLCPAGSSPGPLTPLTTDGPVEIVGCIVETQPTD
jgi:hypothetical protein